MNTYIIIGIIGAVSIISGIFLWWQTIICSKFLSHIKFVSAQLLQQNNNFIKLAEEHQAEIIKQSIKILSGADERLDRANTMVLENIQTSKILAQSADKLAVVVRDQKDLINALQSEYVSYKKDKDREIEHWKETYNSILRRYIVLEDRSMQKSDDRDKLIAELARKPIYNNSNTSISGEESM